MKVKITKVFLIVFFSVSLDRLSKFFISSSMALDEKIYISNLFSIHYIKNTGAAFSFFEGQKFLLIAIPIILIVIVLIFLYKNIKTIADIYLICFSLIIAGGAANLFDRLIYGEVIDFIAVFDFPVFNFADIYITVGSFIFITSYIIKECRGKKDY